MTSWLMLKLCMQVLMARKPSSACSSMEPYLMTTQQQPDLSNPGTRKRLAESRSSTARLGISSAASSSSTANAQRCLSLVWMYTYAAIC